VVHKNDVAAVAVVPPIVVVAIGTAGLAQALTTTHTKSGKRPIQIPSFLPSLPGQYVDSSLFPYVAVAVVVAAVAEVPKQSH
jgi:hypothetical protein